MSEGRTSGTPPTFVLTTKSPQEAASRIVIPKASIREVARNIWPRQSTSLTLWFGTSPSKLTLSLSQYLSKL